MLSGTAGKTTSGTRVANPKYSICIINYNNASTLTASLRSILEQIDGASEVVAVDSCSTDGSIEMLENFASVGKIRLIVKKCSRGMGRQLVFENSVGEYVVTNLDTDDVFKQELRSLLSLYHAKCEGKVLLAISDKSIWSQNVTIGPRSVIQSLGGWRDLQWCEDWDLWRRAARTGCFRWAIFPLVERIGTHPERRRLSVRLRQRYGRYRDYIRLGRPIFNPRGRNPEHSAKGRVSEAEEGANSAVASENENAIIEAAMSESLYPK